LGSAAASQTQVQVAKTLLGHHKVAEVASRDFARIPGSVTLEELVDKEVLAKGRRCFVVTGNDGSSGLVTLSMIKTVPRSAWPQKTAAEIMIPLEKTVSILPSADLWTAFEKMGRDGVNQMPVVNKADNHGAVEGMLSREDIVHYLRVLQGVAK
jgi:CBS domain-containing protein